MHLVHDTPPTSPSSASVHAQTTSATRIKAWTTGVTQQPDYIPARAAYVSFSCRMNGKAGGPAINARSVVGNVMIHGAGHAARRSHGDSRRREPGGQYRQDKNGKPLR